MSLLQDLRFAVRVLVKNRWFTLMGAVVLALGIGANNTVFAVIALVLAAVGLYAVTAYSVTQHTRDIGVRMVLGAQSSQVIWIFLRRAFVQLAVGLTLGLAGAFGVGQ